MNQQFLKNLREGFTKWFILAISIVILFFAVLAILRIGFAFTIYTAVANWVTVRLGFDYYVAEFTAVVLTALIMMFLPSILWFFISGRNKEKATIATIFGVGLICLLVYIFGQDVYFNRQTGEPLRYYADTPKGRVYSFTEGYEPQFGIKFEPYTSEIANDKKSIAIFQSKPIEPARVRTVKFNPEVSTLVEFSIKTGFFSEPDSIKLRLHPTEMFISTDNSVSLEYSLCNSGQVSYSTGKEGKFYLWYTPKNGATSINWESSEINLKPGECVIKSTKTSTYEGFQFSTPLGKLQATTNPTLVFGTLDFSNNSKISNSNLSNANSLEPYTIE